MYFSETGMAVIIYNNENGLCDLTNSTLKNNIVRFVSEWPYIFFGVVENKGTMNITKCVFENNTYENLYPFIVGSYNIYNWGKLTATHNYF